MAFKNPFIDKKIKDSAHVSDGARSKIIYPIKFF